MPVVLIVATLPATQLHDPPGVASARVIELPIHNSDGPEIFAGRAFTVRRRVRTQPAGEVYVISVLPDAIAVAAPVVLSIVATSGVLLVHVPPGIPLVNVPATPTQSCEGPAIGAGNGSTVTIVVYTQPADSE